MNKSKKKAVWRKSLRIQYATTKQIESALLTGKIGIIEDRVIFVTKNCRGRIKLIDLKHLCQA